MPEPMEGEAIEPCAGRSRTEYALAEATTEDSSTRPQKDQRIRVRGPVGLDGKVLRDGVHEERGRGHGPQPSTPLSLGDDAQVARHLLY